MNLTYAPGAPVYAAATSTRGRWAGDRFLLGLSVLLAAYALLGRPAAYVGVPPLFVGEVVLVWGVVTAARFGRWGPVLGGPAAGLLLAFMALALARTVPYLGAYGLDAARDAMQVGYGAFALAVAALVVARPERLAAAVERYGRSVPVFVGALWALYLVSKLAGPSLPELPWAPGVAGLDVKGGDALVHLCGVAVFLWTGLGARTPALVGLLVLNTGIVMVSNRGGMVAFVLGCAVAWALRPPTARAGRFVYAFALFVVLGLVVGPTVEIHDGGREISVEQVWLNVQSVFGQGGAHLDGTKEWRLAWWEEIWGYTVGGDAFWTGRGFGVNLAEADGFDVDSRLRSPHNGHMTVLARMGVPGALLWAALLLAWAAAVVRQWAAARRAGRARWMAVFAWLGAYWTAALVNAAFDVYLEGPMGGVWFWSVFGVGLAAAWTHAHRPDVLPEPAPPEQAPPLPWAW